jgi:Flp pilus assembly pilin Flp
MRNFNKVLQHYLNSEHGASLVEAVSLAALVAVVCIGSLQYFTRSTGTQICKAHYAVKHSGNKDQQLYAEEVQFSQGNIRGDCITADYNTYNLNLYSNEEDVCAENMPSGTDCHSA